MKNRRLSEIDIAGLERPVTVICHFDDLFGAVPQNPAVHFQVVLRPDRVTPGGDFIAFDSADGDQVHGWMRRDRIVVDEVLRIGNAQCESRAG